MQNEKIYLARISRFAEAVKSAVYPASVPLQATYVHAVEPIPHETALQADYQPIATDDKWGESWESAWFRFTGEIPASFADCEVGALINVDGEAAVWRDGAPWIGLTGKIGWFAAAAKQFVPLADCATAGEKVELLVEACANTLFGEVPEGCRFQRADLVTVNRAAFALHLDVETLLSLAEALPERSPRRQKILRGLNDAANVWHGGAGMNEAHEITAKLLSSPACPSALTAWSMGHAHIDLAWLWPIRETRRKAGRTFATALRMMERYPDYRFGASQPQLYEWLRKDYPALFEQVKARIAEGRWEAQGASWVEMDTNITGGESLIRQFVYGRRYFAEMFDRHPNYLFLPDCFGFTAALPQILRGCGLPYFLTQKISWNETNTFPHHTFNWVGLDGSSVLAHFLPTNDYNGSNLPKQLVEAEQRYAQSDVCDDFMNLYGVGDGGGGPSAEYIERGLRGHDLEGAPRVKFDFVQSFLDKLAETPANRLPAWRGELYLELHRGTYTTQAKTKRFNRKIEQALHDLEFLSAALGFDCKSELDDIWKDTLLHQFHDILPGSSIGWVYRDCEALSAKNLARLETLIEQAVRGKFGDTGDASQTLVVNTLGCERCEVVRIGDEEHLVSLPPFGWITLDTTGAEATLPEQVNGDVIENDLLRVEFDANGAVISMFDKLLQREWLAGPANQLLLWEDLPNNWGAWDVNHFYRETQPDQAKLVEQTTVTTPLATVRTQKLTVGESTIEQRIELVRGSRLLRIDNTVNWREKHKMLRVTATPAVQADEASCEIQFGQIKRPTRPNTSWDAAKFEIAAHRYIDISQPDGGFAVLNDCKYGHSVIDGVMEINLLRSPADVDKQADLGEHTFAFGYLPHADDLPRSGVVNSARCFNAPVRLYALASQPEQPRRSMFRLNSASVKLETVKPAEDGDGVIVRMYESAGQNAAGNFRADESWISICECDMLENDIGEIEAQDRCCSLSFKPFQIRTFRIRR